MARPTKQKALKLPKKPKNRTVDNMEKYLSKVKEVKKENTKRVSDDAKKLKKWTALQKQVKDTKR